MPQQVTDGDVLDALRPIIDPDFNKSIVDLGFIKDLKINGSHVAFAIELTTPDVVKLLAGLASAQFHSRICLSLPQAATNLLSWLTSTSSTSPAEAAKLRSCLIAAALLRIAPL